jgi:AraC-like DNA-binding protein
MAARWVRDPQIGAAAIQPLLAALVERGADVAAFCARLGLDPRIVHDPEARIPLGRLDATWNCGAELLRDPHLGLHLAESVSASSFGLLSYLGASCPTWGDGVRTVCSYFRVFSEASSYHLTIAGDSAVVTATHDAPSAEPVRQRVEFTVAVMHGYGRRYVDGDWRAADVFLEHPAPPGDTLAEHQRVFGRLPRFSAGASGFAFPAALLDRPMRTSEPRLAMILERLASRLLADVPDATSVAHRIRMDLRRTGLHADLSLEAVARRLGMSPRTLQRRLRDESTSLSDLVDQVRRTVATRLLTAPETGIAEVAYEVGFSEPAAFHRAFKRWTGLTPAEFRRPSDKPP